MPPRPAPSPDRRGGRLLAWSLAGLAALAAWSAWLRGSPPAPATTRSLWLRRDRYLDRPVDVAGTLERFLPGGPNEHFALEDEGFRVGLRGAAPETLLPLLGRRVDAQGVFEFSESYGGYVQVERLSPSAGSAARSGPSSP